VVLTDHNHAPRSDDTNPDPATHQLPPDQLPLNPPDVLRLEERCRELVAELVTARATARRERMIADAVRRAYADLIAAGWAALGAQAAGEPDPWAYLADELPRPPAQHPLSADWQRWGWCRGGTATPDAGGSVAGSVGGGVSRCRWCWSPTTTAPCSGF
jgi:hypothetical protein